MMRSNLIKQLRSLKSFIQDFYYYETASAPGFLQLILALRFVVLLILTVNSGLMAQSGPVVQGSTADLTQLLLWLYFSFIIGLLSLAILQPDHFESRLIQVLQVILDGVIITYFYWAAHNPDSNIFLLYFLPLLVIARFFDLRAVLLFLSAVALASSLIWLVTLPPDEISSPQTWFLSLFPQLGFLVIMAVFYLIYYRRRTMAGWHQATELGIEEQLNHLWQGWLSIDRQLQVTQMDQGMAQRHGHAQETSTCAEVLCRGKLTAGVPCSGCPLTQAMESQTATEAEMRLVDRYGNPYLARLAAQPILDHQNKVVGAFAWVQDLNERRGIEQRLRALTEDLERVVDQNRLEDRARVQKLAHQLETISQASESVRSSDLLSGADEIVQALASLLGCRLAMVRQHQVNEKTGLAGLVLSNFLGLDPKDIGQVSFLDLTSSSLVVEAFLTGEDQYIEDLENSHQMVFDDLRRKYGLRSMACFPLKAYGKPIGTFSLYRNRRQGFSHEDLHLGRALANNLAALLTSLRQVDRDRKEAERRKHELDVLSALSRNLVPIENLHTLAQLVANTVRTELHAETAAVFLNQNNILSRVSIAGMEDSWFMDESYQVGLGLTGKAAQPEAGEFFGTPTLENDVEHSQVVIPDNLARYSQRLATSTVRHLLAVPLNGQEGTFGVLRVVNKLSPEGKLDPFGFTPEDEALMTTLACIVAVAMENARLFELEKKKRLLEQALRRGTHELSSTLEKDEVLNTILEQLKNVVPYNSASLFLQEPDGLRLKAMAGFSPQEEQQLRHVRLDPDKNIPYQRMCATRQPVLVNDLWQDPVLEPIIGTRRIRSWIGAPLIFQEEVLGWLSMDNYEPDQYTPEDAEIGMAFAQQAAIAINNARQYQMQREQVDFLTRLEHSLAEISSTTEKKEVMNRIAQAASQLMNCEAAGVALYDEEKNEIYALADAGYVGVPEEYARTFRFPLDHLGGRVIRERKVFATGDAMHDPHSIFGERLIWPILARGVIAAPLILGLGEHIVGVLYAASHQPRDWSESHQAFFSILSTHAAIAIRNAELWNVRERRAQLLKLLHNLSIAGQLTNNPDVIYNVLLTAVTAEYGLRFNRALLLLYNNERKALVGFTGIGQLNRREAYHTWETLDNHSRTFEGYLQDVLERGIIHYTSLHYKAKNLEIPIQSDTNEVFSQAYRSGKILKVDATDPQVAVNTEFYKLFEPGQFVLAPLIVNREVVGMLVVDNQMTGEPIRKMELDLLESCASQAAAAIYRSNLHQQLEERIQVMGHFVELAQAFSELTETRKVLERIALAANDILHADISHLALYDSEQRKLLVEESVMAGASTHFQHESTFSSHGLTSLAMQEPGGLVVIEDITARKDLRSRFVDQEGVRSVVVCRLELRKSVVGLLYVNYRQLHSFSDFELETLRMLARQAAVVIHNMRLLVQNESLATQRERSRLREDLHDILNTYAFKVMEPAESIFEKEKAKRRKDQRLVAEAEELWRFSRHTYKQLERVLEDMREPVLVEYGLPEALRWLVESTKLPGLETSISNEVRASAEVEHALYRICQEAISNIRKHAHLPEQGEGLVRICLERHDGLICLEIEDQGQGFAPQIVHDRRQGIGLQAMSSWAHKVGAQIEIQPRPGKGTRITVNVPNPEDKERAE